MILGRALPSVRWSGRGLSPSYVRDGVQVPVVAAVAS